MYVLDLVTSGIHGVVQHHCRLCMSLRESITLGLGGSGTLYDDIDLVESQMLLDDCAKAERQVCGCVSLDTGASRRRGEH